MIFISNLVPKQACGQEMECVHESEEALAIVSCYHPNHTNHNSLS